MLQIPFPNFPRAQINEIPALRSVPVVPSAADVARAQLLYRRTAANEMNQFCSRFTYM